MKKILFPTDFSETSLNAFVYALRLAKKMDAELITLHVCELPMGTAVGSYDYILHTYEINDWADFENFKSEVPKLRAIAEKEQLQRVKMSHMLERGDTVTEILEVIAKIKPVFVVIGTKGATGLKEVFLGSMAEKIMNRSHTPVLAIPDKAKYKPMKNILFLTHYKKMEMGKLTRIHDFALHFKAHIDVLEVKSHHEPDDNYYISKWKNYFKGNDIYFNILASDTTEDTVLDYIDLHKITVVALPVHDKNFFQRMFAYSLSRQLAYHSTIPVLSIPA